MFFEIDFLEVRIHVESFRSEVIGAGDIRNDTFPVLPDRGETHPHVPVPLLSITETHSQVLIKGKSSGD